MQITSNIYTTFDLNQIIHSTTSTLNRKLTTLLQRDTDEKQLAAILNRARAVRMLIRNDADATVRLSSMQPARADEYEMLWAMQANKLISEIGLLCRDVLPASAAFNESEPILKGDLRKWASDKLEVKPEPKDLQLEKEEEAAV